MSEIEPERVEVVARELHAASVAQWCAQASLTRDEFVSHWRNMAEIAIRADEAYRREQRERHMAEAPTPSEAHGSWGREFDPETGVRVNGSAGFRRDCWL